MENPIDNIVDLGFVNYVKHPSNPNYIVYRFADAERAASFEKALKAGGIWFEKDTEAKRQKTYTLFGVHKNDYKRSQQINYDVEALHKKPFIPFRWFRYFMLLLFATVMTMASIGYCEQQKKLDSHNNSDTTVNNEILTE